VFEGVIDFRSLGLEPEITSIGPFVLRWYSLAYLFGIILGWMYLRKLLKKPGAPMSLQHADDFVTWATIGIILGGRLGYVIFYAPATFIADPIAIFKLWEGGMSFHGGVAGVTLAIAWFARRNGIDFVRICDYVACVYPIGHLLGRLANFNNGELWGRPTDGTWGIIFPDAGPEPRHPSQLYEGALEGLLLFIILWFLFWKTGARRYPGLLVGVFSVGMGVARFAVEFFREPDRQLGILETGLTMGQTLTVPLVIVGVYMIATSRKRMEKGDARRLAEAQGDGGEPVQKSG
jgi:phosphatidylglycerol:prolipoprotein diacylglycerol transferase